jgi:hypothetical protein
MVEMKPANLFSFVMHSAESRIISYSRNSYATNAPFDGKKIESADVVATLASPRTTGWASCGSS